MDHSISLPSYAELFGKLDFKKGDEARSVYSPAAYLADLLQLLDDSFADPSLAQRRPDIGGIALNAEQTFTELPYLDIVNEVLEHVIGGDGYAALKAAKYPFQLPFDLDSEKVKKYLHYLGVGAEQLYKQFALQPDADLIAREYLGLSQAAYDLITTPSAAEADIQALYPPSDNPPWQDLIEVGAFLRATSLGGPALRELLFQSLSASAKDSNGNAERSQASAFFINHNLGGYAQLDANEELLIWSDSAQAIPPAWFERVARFIRLANSIGLSFSELDLILRSCCTKQIDTSTLSIVLDADAIRTIAVIKQLHDRFELPIDVVCSLFSSISTLGIGDEKLPLDLFDRIFNLNFAPIDKHSIAGSAFTPAAYATAAYTPLACSGDLLALDNKDYRRRVGKALGVSDPDLIAIVTQFRAKYAARPGATILAADATIGLPALALLHRIAVLTEMLDISYAELFGLLDLLESDPSIRQANNFDLLIDGEVQGLDCYHMLEQGTVAELLWLVQMLVAVAAWMQANDFSSEELNQILSGRYGSAAGDTSRKQKIAVLNELYQQFKAVMLTPEVFASDRFGARAAQVIHQVLAEQSSGLVCPSDPRLARFDAALAPAAAYRALDQLGAIHPQDFQQLGLEQRLVDKVIANLIFKGYLDTEGAIAEARLPSSAAEFRLASDFSAYADAVFTLIHDLYADAAQDQAGETDQQEDEVDQDLDETDQELDDVDQELDDTDQELDAADEQLDDTDQELGETDQGLVDADEQLVDADEQLDDPIELALFPSDLEALEELTEAERNELYDNLIFNGYVDAEGNLLEPDFFARPENAADLRLNADLGAVAEAVFKQLAHQIAQFDTTPLALDRDSLAELPLSAAEIDDLVENLKFNGYIDQANVWIDKRAMLALTIDQFSLALAFYPQRRKILEAIKAQIDARKAEFYTLAQDAFGALADAAVAQQVHARLAEAYLTNNRIDDPAFFLDPDNLADFALGDDVGAAEHTLIFNQIATILQGMQPYQMPLSVLEELDFDADETAELIEALTEGGYLTPALLLPEDKIGYFLNINNALECSIPAFTDFNKDIFFVLHGVAKESAAAIDEIVAAIKAQAERQAGVVLDVLQDGLGAEADLLGVACRYLLRGAGLVEAWMLPILATVDPGDAVSAEPAGSAFNLLYKRLLQFSLLAGKLHLSAEEAEIAWRDQDLAEKFPEKLTLPPGVEQFDALLESPDGVIYLFKDAAFWAYSARDYTPVKIVDGAPSAWAANEPASIEKATGPLIALSDRFAGVGKIDAAFSDSGGTCYLVAGGACFYREKTSAHWLKKDRIWGQIKNNFADPARIDTAFRDQEGKTYLFAGSQYIRYSGADYAKPVDEGYPRLIAGNWEQEGLNAALPDPFKQGIDASFQGADDKTYLFKDHTYVDSDNLGEPHDIRAMWGRVRNNFQNLAQLDAAYADGAEYLFFAGDQVIVYQDSIENDGVCVREGYPQRIEAHFANLPAEFESGLEAAFKGQDGAVYLFKDGKSLAIPSDGTAPSVTPIKDRWGVVTNRIAATGKIDAAFVGLDGKTYLFSADQYVRYSGADYTQVDAGYPRTIAPDWGGLATVNEAFVLDGKTYLLGADAGGQGAYVRYSQRDYTAQDAGYPRPIDDNWWNLPAKLVQGDFKQIDAVFTGKDGRTYLFAGNQFIVFDNKHRWWSEPQLLSAQWDSIPFDGVDAAFVGKDGKIYLFRGHQYIRYSNSYSKIDDRYPNTISSYWGNVANNIAKTGRVDAALVVESREIVGGSEQRTMHTYLFSGNQYVRYKNGDYAAVENGYPKYIAASLKAEPRFANLPAGFEAGIDAALADQRTVYLFKGAKCQAISEKTYQVYESPGFANPGCAFIEDGALFIEEANTWQRYSALEGSALVKAGATPAALRGVPEPFRHGLSAVLRGADGNTYLFKGADCFDTQLGRAYPLAEVWGRARNNIYQNNSIDAAFVGRDGKTYLFSGDQFVSYAGATYGGAEIDGPPQCIKEHWGGLAGVALAFVRDTQTYLFEKAGADGRSRYVRYSGTDYSRPDAGFPQIAGMEFWQIPAAAQTEGFDCIDAVLFERDNMFLISRNMFLQYNSATDRWFYPRPLSRIWRNFPFEPLKFAHVKTAFSGADGATYFFAKTSYVRYDGAGFTQPAPINGMWGIEHNNFIHSQGNQIDAAFVYQNSTTYLFSGDQYVRYSSPDYRAVDAGYPRPLVGNLRQEPGFQNLPADFDDLLLDRIAASPEAPINAVVGNRRNLYLLIGESPQIGAAGTIPARCYVISQSPTAAYDLGIIGKVKNHLADWNRVDAAFVGAAVHGYRPTYLFAGDQYVRYSGDDYTYVDDGYPRSIAAGFAAEMGIAALPDAFNEGIDAALDGADGQTYLFKGGEYLALSSPSAAPIRGTWGKIANRFIEQPGQIDAGFIAPAGGLYLFKGDQYIRYATPQQEYADEGYPRAIKDNWGNLPIGFEAAIDGAFVFEGVTYMVKGAQYVRYSDTSYQAIDRIYPQAFTYRWGAWADYLLSDIKTIARFKQLQDAHASADGSLVTFLNPPPGVVKTPHELLAGLFGWDIDDLQWLKRRNGFLGGKQLFEQQFQIELIIKLADIFAVTTKLGAAPSDVYANVWQPLYAAGQPQPALAAPALYRYLAQNTSAPDWQTLERQIHDELNLIKRDALMPTAMAQVEGIRNSRDLYERYLIDVEMGSSGITSRIQEAIAATQLFFHRYFVNLEDAELRGNDQPALRRDLQAWWKWMKNYRVWEANRKVFLYPENYIRPELRDTKTPAFKTLEDDLLQGEITDASVQRAYKKYLDEYTEVSRLTIAGGYVYQPELSSATRRLVLFGRTKTDPRRYYYRTSEFLGGQGESALWSPWMSVNVQIDADKVYPVYAFDRVFVFWARAEATHQPPPATALTTTTKDNTQTISAATPASYAIKIYYSFYNLNKEWVPAQTLDADISVSSAGDALKALNDSIKLSVENSDKLYIQGSEMDHENIVINCAYSLNGVEANRAYYLTPELYTKPAAKLNFTNPGPQLFNQLFDEPRLLNAGSGLISLDALFKLLLLGLNPGANADQIRQQQAQVSPVDVVMFNTLEATTDGPWFSFDYKGGSFLCKPAAPPLSGDAWPHALAGNPDRLPTQPPVDAAFATADGSSYFFSSAAKGYQIAPAGQPPQELLPTKARWGLVRNAIAETGVVDAALMLGGTAYLFSGSQYLTFSKGLDLADADSPRELASNADGLPKWQQLSAAFGAADGKAYFFDNQKQQYAVLENGRLGSAKAVIGQWGRMRDPAPISAAWVLGAATYLAYGDRYARFQGSGYSAPETGFPRPFPGLAAMDGLKDAKRADAIDAQKLANIFFAANSAYFQYADDAQLQQAAITPSGASEHGDFFKHLNEEPLIALALKGARVYAFKRKAEGGQTYATFCVYNRDAKADAKDEDDKKKDDDKKKGSSKGKWEQHSVDIVDGQGRKILIDQALVGSDGMCYLFAGAQYMRSADWGDLIEKTDAGPTLRWNPAPGTIAKDWLRLTNRIAETGLVDAALARGSYTYLFSGDQYIRYTGSAYDLIDDGYPKPIATNNEGLPPWNQIGAVLKVNDNQIYFFDNSDQTYTEPGNLGTQHATRPRWGIVRTNFTTTGSVDAAYVSGNVLTLTSGDQYVRYSLADGTTIGQFVDAGYPKTLGIAAAGLGQIDAAFTQGNHLYLFAADRYFKLAPAQDLASLPSPSFIQGNWGNLPYQLRAGLDGAFQRGDTLFLFKGAQYGRFAGNLPYEIVEGKYDITRLTTSTAYLLNQRLFSGGVARLLSLETQELDELPSFSAGASTPTNIKVRPERVGSLPSSENLDFSSANANYYWEIFFHAPFLIAQALNTGQKFEEAKQWYEYIFDPTARTDCWRFLLFQNSQQPAADDWNTPAQIQTYLNDPFDPHAIAALRPAAYRKAIVMAYVDNLLDWGDMLFRQYTRESINEARMLYILAYDLLGERPENLGAKILSPDKTYRELENSTESYDLTLYLPGPAVVGDQTLTLMAGTVHESVGNPYFFVPENSQFGDYWARVEDRLYKIRHSLNILGISQPLPLFEPPIDPMALVQAIGSGAALSSALASLNIPVPHYRFSFMLGKARDLVLKLNGFGGDLLVTLEKKDAEELSLLQNRQEAVILSMTRSIKEAQIAAAAATVAELEASLQSASNRVTHYQQLIDQGLLPIEQAQIGLMIAASATHGVSAGIKLAASIAHGFPQVTIGLFSFGTQMGGEQAGNALGKAAEFTESLGTVLSSTGEVLGTYANHQRTGQDWQLQLSIAEGDVNQITHQLEGAQWQLKIAQRDLEIQDKEIEHNAAIKAFMQSKFTNAQLYQWMIGRLSALYFQTYSMAYGMAKAAEKALQYERGLKESDASYIQPLYWESQRNGLLAGESLGLDLDRMEKAAIESNSRGFEITKKISLLELDPVALLQLKSKGACEFAFSEALFDYDFPGHYCRQIRTLEVVFAGPDDQRLPINATLTQLGHKTVLEPDAKAVKYLLDPKDQPPPTLRSDWRASQQIALSHVTDPYEKNNGLFELRYDDERYLPFEGAGAVSTWRLELSGTKRGYSIDDLLDVTITLRYSAEQGGAAFATAVKGMLKPYPTARYFDMARDFPDEWAAFSENGTDELTITLSRDMFPAMSSSKITGLFAHYQLAAPASLSMELNDDKALTLKDGTFLPTSGLSIGSQGAEWTFTLNGSKDALQNIDLVVGYKASVA